MTVAMTAGLCRRVEMQQRGRSGYGIFAQRYNSSVCSSRQQLSGQQDDANDQTDPSVAMDDSGNFVVSWTSANQDSGSTKGV